MVSSRAASLLRETSLSGDPISMRRSSPSEERLNLDFKASFNIKVLLGQFTYSANIYSALLWALCQARYWGARKSKGHHDGNWLLSVLFGLQGQTSPSCCHRLLLPLLFYWFIEINPHAVAQPDLELTVNPMFQPLKC